MIRFWPLHSDRGMTVTGVVHADLFGPILIQTRTDICPWSLFLLSNVDAPRKRQSLERMHKFGSAVRSKRHLPVALLTCQDFRQVVSQRDHNFASAVGIPQPRASSELGPSHVRRLGILHEHRRELARAECHETPTLKDLPLWSQSVCQNLAQE